MAIHRLRGSDGRLERDAQGRYHYEMTFRQGKRQCRRRAWFPDDAAALTYVQQERGDPGAPPVTWQQCLDLYLSVSAITPGYEKDVKKAVGQVEKLAPCPADCSLQSFSAWVRTCAKETTGRTANKHRAAVLSVVHTAQEHGLLRTVPFEKAPTMPHRALERAPWPVEELPKYLAVMGPELRLPLLLIALTGERLRAILNVRWRDVDLQAGSMVVTKKGGRRRTILLTESMRAVFVQAEATWPRVEEADYVFRNTRRRPWQATAFCHAMNRACDQQKPPLARRTAHQLRHLMGDTAAGLNFNRDMIQAALGHDNPETAAHYIHPEAERAREVHESVARATLLQHIAGFLGQSHSSQVKADQGVLCPHCGHKFIPNKEFASQVEAPQ